MISAEQQSDSVIHILLFHILFPLWFIIGYWIEFPVLYGLCLLSRFSRVQLFAALWTTVARFLSPWDCPGKNTEVGCYALLQGIFLTQGLNPRLLYLPTLAGGFFTTSANLGSPLILFSRIRTLLFVHPIYNNLHLVFKPNISLSSPSSWQPQICPLQ